VRPPALGGSRSSWGCWSGARPSIRRLAGHRRPRSSAPPRQRLHQRRGSTPPVASPVSVVSSQSHDQVVTAYGWSTTFGDATNDDGVAEGLGSTGDSLNIAFPGFGVIIYESAINCTFTLYPTAGGPKYTFNGGYDDHNTLSIPGTGSSGSIPVNATGGFTCPVGTYTAALTATYQLSPTLQDG
jgi:hypothetical protein